MWSRVGRNLSQLFWRLVLGLAVLEPMGATYIRVCADDVLAGDLDEPADRSFERTVIRTPFPQLQVRR